MKYNTNKSITIINKKTNKQSKQYFKGYINLINNNLNLDEKTKINNILKYYLIMRMLTPIDLAAMSKKDQNIILYYIIDIYNNINGIEDLLKV